MIRNKARYDAVYVNQIDRHMVELIQVEIFWNFFLIEIDTQQHLIDK